MKKRLLWVILGMACWHVLFMILQGFINFDIYDRIDGLWMKKAKGAVYRNIVGTRVFRVDLPYYGDQFLYTVTFFPRGVGNGYGSTLAFDSIVDIRSWTEGESVSSSVVVHHDMNFDYHLYHTSDGIYMYVDSRKRLNESQ